MLGEAGIETTYAFMLYFIQIMVAHPEIQNKAREEIDSLVGQSRAPVLEDIEHLPYLRAIILEVCFLVILVANCWNPFPPDTTFPPALTPWTSSRHHL